jgi:diguanylate cyclase (GGDEF)-like protein/PAS domain S-box-containing protein
MTTHVEAGGAERLHHEMLNEFLPLGVVVIDEIGTVKYVNARASEMTGYLPVDVVGRSMLDLIHPDDVEFVIASLAHGGGYSGMIMGPARIRYRHRDGDIRWTEYWAHETPEAFGYKGYIFTMSTESATDNLTVAVNDIASGAPLEACLASITRAVTGFPLVAIGSLLVGQGAQLVAHGDWPFAGGALIDDRAMPWWTVQPLGVGLDVEVSNLPEHARSLAEAAGFRSIWVRPVVTASGQSRAMFVAWRHEPGFASPNQERHLASAVDVARLAFDHHEHLQRLDAVAHTDHLTGLGNRAALTRCIGELTQPLQAALYIDLDHFKQVNDSLGHDGGDEVLIAAATRIAEQVAPHPVFRIGGDEFVVLLDEAATQAAARVVAALAEPWQVGDQQFAGGASVGVAVHAVADSAEQTIRRADAALLQAKRDGKGCWRLAPEPGH